MFRKKMAVLGIEEVISARKSPWQNPFVERVSYRGENAVCGANSDELLPYVLLNLIAKFCAETRVLEHFKELLRSLTFAPVDLTEYDPVRVHHSANNGMFPEIRSEPFMDSDAVLQR